MSPEEARQVIYNALVSIDPDCFGHPGRLGNLSFRVEPRGTRFDVSLSDADHLFDEFDAAIRAALGDSAAVVKDMKTGYHTSPTTSAPPVVPPTIITTARLELSRSAIGTPHPSIRA